MGVGLVAAAILGRRVAATDRSIGTGAVSAPDDESGQSRLEDYGSSATGRSFDEPAASPTPAIC